MKVVWLTNEINLGHINVVIHRMVYKNVDREVVVDHIVVVPSIIDETASLLEVQVGIWQHRPKTSTHGPWTQQQVDDYVEAMAVKRGYKPYR